ncbi:MAG: DUF2510 domain-containing protein, partial [Actinomycetota bacterium]|nr:DUF2510 domain-containing protein [Actinomycetota bacterium]
VSAPPAPATLAAPGAVAPPPVPPAPPAPPTVPGGPPPPALPASPPPAAPIATAAPPAPAAPAAQPIAVPRTAAAANPNPPAWHPDPLRRYQHRYWDGRRWTAQVSNNGVAGTDPYGNKGTPFAPPGNNPAATAAWYLDPAGRHEHRYWNGRKWTAQVSNVGVVGDDPPNVEGF